VAQAIAAAAAGAELILVRVIPDLASSEEANQARAYLERVVPELQTAGVAVSCQVRTGSAPDQIVAAAEQNGAELLVMATHGRTGVARAFLGSIAEQVLAHTATPVVLVRAGAQPATGLRTLLVPVDGTVGGALAVGSAVELARASNAHIVLLEVAVPIPNWVYAAEFGTPLAMPADPSWDDQALHAAQGYVSGLAARLREQGLSAEGITRVGDAAPMIAKIADERAADLIVMSSHGLTGAARTVLGSVSDAVVRTARRPVLLVRRRGAAQDAEARPLTTAGAKE
jgi:nucleotide-binding universal stress UspA family protein